MTGEVGRRVVVTGMGLVTCLGVGVRHVWRRILDGHCGISGLHATEFKEIPCRVAGYVPRGTSPGELNLDSHIPPADQRVMSLASAYALVAAEEALVDSGWKPRTEDDRHRAGVAVGMGLCSLHQISEMGHVLREKGYRRVSPHFIPSILTNMAAGQVSLKFGLKGPNHAVSTACTTGLHAIGDAARFIQYGDADLMVAGGTEANIDPLSIAGFARMRALSTRFNDTPELSSRPFDKDRDGFVMSEGSGVVILEELSHAQKRGANIYGEVLGYGLSADANHITAPAEDGSGAYNCMKYALKYANIDKKHVGYVNAHATSTPLGDKSESSAIHRLFGPNCDNLLVSSTKGAIGHLLGGAGSVEAIFTILACQSGKVPPTVNLNQSDTDVDLNYVSKTSSDWLNIVNGKRFGISNSFGFGGTNASICFSNYFPDSC
ncbi:OXSM-like protein [Mya arenaria]|uniref:3-oxoacyl-[acyl-carrier-protein] synthase n=1 Tax=Mya arenaria TaxID=6604 RepID=A0ABY7E2N1_MYAAR|nr:3-oxoacyl-[acyl-carrier-protein] synthase, mitochondrial-like [Mya arenaria]XP_052799542.1 3-oxoacyl-[acyl-carrier-protein] synthase, mitochondrial-like [Mya arenaria]XP_052799543.1 3-oxoacyl-[acyl-carrier-protein] synthase, mitochondrial-like [Mya arenaria]XP_052799545.1 3-oxoacyl-[acyl-carrier-protein] synthase, mitochondrial-like [Mya arenaria]XP_052799546.1 3-oxoacyl-[acyl-carrier-protein] synthase, mitochondrial-like [Mya arenaria]XP_052799547.1 3-oxoacyl-[acyl-carrier-protein] synthas